MFVRDLAMTVQAAFARTVPKMTFYTLYLNTQLSTHLKAYHFLLLEHLVSNAHWLTFLSKHGFLHKITKHNKTG